MPKILLVEDKPELRDMLSRRLIKRNFDVVLACDGVEGCTKARSERPDLILMDMAMPGGDEGLVATRELKAAADTKSIPIIILTAHNLPEERERAIQAGCDEFEIKPINLDTLLAKMQKLLQGGGNV